MHPRWSYTFRPAWALLVVALAWLVGPDLAVAAAPPTDRAGATPDPAPPAAATPPDAAVPPVDPLRSRARQLRALLDGSLDPEVDAADLLVIDLADPTLVGVDGARLLDIIRAASLPPAAPADPTAPPSAPADERPPAEDFEAAYVAFLRLSPEHRARILAAHEQRRAEHLASRRADERRATALAAAERHAEQLEAYLAGTLDVEVDPAPLLRIDLADDEELPTSAARRAAWIDAAPDPSAATDPEATPASPPGAHARLDALRLRFLGLSTEERAALRATHERRTAEAIEAAEAEQIAEAEAEAEETDEEAKTAQQISDAELEAAAAAADRQAALEAARMAKTEAKRILAEERARLLGIKEAQAHHEAELNRRKAQRDDNHDKALEWNRRVGELERSPKFASEKASEADPMYQEIRTELAAMRRALREELERIRKAGADVPAVGDGLDRDLPADVDRGDLAELRDELLANERTLTELEQTVGWELAQGLRDDVVLLNRTRLVLLDLASSDLRASVTGFGPQGVDQVERELDQISVELSFHALKLTRYRRDAIARFQSATIPLLIGSVQFLLALAAYAWWRRRGTELLAQLEQLLQNRRPATRALTTGLTLLWYLQRVRRPLELLLVLWVLFGLIGDVEDLPEFALLGIVALWVLLGLAVILFVDALAARESRYSTSAQDTSSLRIHSLRVVGLNVIAVGLVLSLTSAMVGRGAIYSWVLSTCWLLSFPVALYLVYQWKPIIFERIEQRAEQGPFVRWVNSKRIGLASFPAAAAAAGYLLLGGLGSWAMRQLSGLEATRRLLAYLFRREVAKQAAATEADGRYTPVDAEIYGVFDPVALPARPLEQVAQSELERVLALAATPRSTLSAVVGERGIGKSVFLSRIQADMPPGQVRLIQCPEAGFEALQARLADLTDDPALRGEALGEALRRLGPLVIALDDVQRLVVPAVNGLRHLDAFTAFARQVGGEVSWIVTIGSAAWHYINRARGDRVFFEQVVVLPHWSEEQLGELIQAQCAAAEIDPSFDGLVVPRQAEAPLPNHGDRTEAGYHRLLWDFSRGNPAVALHAFRESLFVTPEGTIVVRLFKEPSAEQIEDLPMPVLFMLRTIVQLELAVIDEVEAATQLPRADIEDAFRFCLARGYLESFEDGVRLAWPWYRTITTVLQRQHLLSAL